MTKRVPLSQGEFALVDDEDYERVIDAGPWYALIQQQGRRRYVYATRNVKQADGSWKPQSLHRFLTGYRMTNHRNRNGLDNRRRNLRPVTGLQRSRAKSGRSVGTSRYKGVSWYAPCGLWRARIKADGKDRTIGYFPGTPKGEREAAECYDRMARQLFGEFAYTNFVGTLDELNIHIGAVI